jgi:hypothetical protein
LWPSWAQLLAKNFREASLSAQFLEIVDWILLAFEPQIAFESAGLGCWLDVISIKTPLGIPSIPSNTPDNLENTGRGLHGNHDISQSHNGNSKDRLVEEHDERLGIKDRGLEMERLDSRSHSESGVKRVCWAKERL